MGQPRRRASVARGLPVAGAPTTGMRAAESRARSPVWESPQARTRGPKRETASSLPSAYVTGWSTSSVKRPSRTRTSIPATSVKPASGPAARTMGSGLAETTTGSSPAAEHAARSSCAARTRRGGIQERANRSASAASSASSNPACSCAAYMYPVRLSRATACSYSAYGSRPPGKCTHPMVTRWRRNASPASSRQSVPSASNAATPPGGEALRTASISACGTTSTLAAALQRTLHADLVVLAPRLRADQRALAVAAQHLGRRAADDAVLRAFEHGLQRRGEPGLRNHGRRAVYRGQPHRERCQLGSRESHQHVARARRADRREPRDRLRTPGGQRSLVLGDLLQDRRTTLAQRAPVLR